MSDPAYLETMAGALARLGTEHALLVSGEDGVDELSISAPTIVVEVRAGRSAVLHRHARGGRPGACRRRTPSPAATRSRTPRSPGASFAGERGVARDLSALNAGAAIYAGGGADSLEHGVRAAEEAIDSGAAAAALERFVERTQALAPA